MPGKFGIPYTGNDSAPLAGSAMSQVTLSLWLRVNPSGARTQQGLLCRRTRQCQFLKAIMLIGDQENTTLTAQ